MLPIEDADIQNFEDAVLKLKSQPSFSSSNISYVACSWGIDYSISSIPLRFIRLQIRFPLRNYNTGFRVDKGLFRLRLHYAKTELFANARQTGGLRKRQLYVCLDRKTMASRSRGTQSLTEFSSSTNPKWLVIVAFSNSYGEICGLGLMETIHCDILKGKFSFFVTTVFEKSTAIKVMDSGYSSSETFKNSF